MARSDLIAGPETEGWLSVPAAIVVGVGSAVGTVAAFTLPAKGDGIGLAALVLTLVYAIYLGFVLTRGGAFELLVEGTFVVVGLTLVGLGLWERPTWLAVGFFLHGFWDLLHDGTHHVLGVRGVPRWYVPACAVYDWILAGGIVVFLR